MTMPPPQPILRELPFSGLPGRWQSAAFGVTADEQSIPLGSLTETTWLTADFYNPHDVMLQLKLQFVVPGGSRAGEIIFGVYPQVRARLRIPCSALSLNAWLLPREGSLLKPMCGGDRVLPEEVETLRLTLLAGPEPGAEWWQSDWKISPEEPALLVRAEAPPGPLLDRLGQPARRHWPGKTGSEEEMVSRLRSQAAGPDAVFPPGWTWWGGSEAVRFEATGYFRTHHDGRRWWLVDPDGGAFWSTGLCCVRPLVESAIDGLDHLLEWVPGDDPAFEGVEAIAVESLAKSRMINYLVANLIRAFGADGWRAAWRRLSANFMRQRGFNTIGNWSEWELGREAGLPFTRPLSQLEDLPLPKVFRDFPDVYEPGFPQACADWAAQLLPTRDDRAFLGYFICNEPNWAFSKQTPAEGMLANTTGGPAREAFAHWLETQYPSDESLAEAWGMGGLSIRAVATGRWPQLPASPAFFKDAETFSGIMARRLFDTLGEACRVVDPHHLNLGARFAHPPAEWMIDALGSFDVFSFNSYSKLPRPVGATLAARLRRPVLIGEWHFGATDTGMPSAGLESVATQEDRGLAYRRYLEAHASADWCVGVHWFTLYDQSALGRFDGESYNCGFLDVCQREQSIIANAAAASHEQLYEITTGLCSISTPLVPNYTRRLSL